MKFRYVITTSALCLLLAAPTMAAETDVPKLPATGEPVKLQPAPLPPPTTEVPRTLVAPIEETRATLGDAGLMYTMQRQGVVQPEDAAASVAAIAPAAGAAAVAPINADKPARTIGGAQVLPVRAISENITGPSNLTTLASALNTAQLSSTLSAGGPYTLFAPSNNAFNKLPDNAFNALLAEPDHARLTKLLNYHIVAGQHDATSIRADIAAGGGTASYDTLAGESLRASIRGNAIVMTDDNGNQSRVALADAYQSNGVMHIVDTVLIPQ